MMFVPNTVPGLIMARRPIGEWEHNTTGLQCMEFLSLARLQLLFVFDRRISYNVTVPSTFTRSVLFCGLNLRKMNFNNYCICLLN